MRYFAVQQGALRMNTNTVYIHSISAPDFSGKVPELREGSFVSVRVIAKQADGMYQLSFAGQRFLAASDIKLTPGSVFKAQLILKDGKLNLVPESALSKGFSVKTVLPENSSLQNVNVLSPELASFFTSLALVPDSVTLKIFQQLQQLGARINLKLMNKVRRAALRFKDRELEAAEAALLLEEKGIESTDDAIEDLLKKRFKWSEEETDNFDNSKPCESDTADFLNQVFEFKNQIFNANSELYEDSENLKKQDAYLPLFNHLKNTENTGNHWVILPYEFVSTKAVEGCGFLKMFFDLNFKNISKMIISAKMKRQEYTFVLYYSQINKCLTDLLFSVTPKPEGGVKRFEGMLKGIFAGMNNQNPVKIKWAEDGISPFSTENTPLNFAEGSV